MLRRSKLNLDAVSSDLTDTGVNAVRARASRPITLSWIQALLDDVVDSFAYT